MSSVWGFVSDLYATAINYGVNPLVFVAIYFGTTPFLLIPIYFLGRIAIKKTDKRYFIPLIIVLISAFLAPYAYVLLFGEGVNIYAKTAIVLFALITLLRYLDKKLGINVIKVVFDFIKRGD